MEKKLILFDIDGVLTQSRKEIEEDVKKIIEKLSNIKTIDLGTIGGSKFEMQKEQLGDTLKYFKYWFAENGLVAYKEEKIIYSGNLLDFFSEDDLSSFINENLKYIANLNIPKKRGCFIQYRTGMLNISPIGRDCNYQDRLEFFEYDKENKIRENMIKYLKEKFSNLKLKYSIGGQISFDVFPIGWDKSFCLKHIDEEYSEIYFFGDQTEEGGNDYEIFNDKRTNGINVKNPNDTIVKLKDLFNLSD